MIGAGRRGAMLERSSLCLVVVSKKVGQPLPRSDVADGWVGPLKIMGVQPWLKGLGWFICR